MPLQSQPGVFAGTLLVSDATLWSSTAGGAEVFGSFARVWSSERGREARGTTLCESDVYRRQLNPLPDSW